MEHRRPLLARPSTLVLAVKIGDRVTVSDNRVLAVGCRIDQANLTTCRVQVYATTATGRVLIGTGTRKLDRTGHASAVVSVTLNATGRRLLGQAVGGLKVTLKATGHGKGSKALSATSHSVLFPQRLAVLPTINPFVFDSTRMLTKAAGHALKTIATDIRHAKAVTCVGHTDSAGDSAYNKALGLRRAKAVCAQLRHLGVHARRTVFSDGETQPRASNATAAGRLSNRRVELRISY
ncbi:MAG TPA: OmpA family protein [Baekduia sp.]|jgi:outer membrane protein OmpA-like peptidoglycan-associated protein